MLYDTAHSLGDLDALGLLRVTKIPQHLEWLTPAQIELIFEVAKCGDQGMRERKARHYSEAKRDELRMLELRDLLYRERDVRGQPVFLCLTWQGKEALEVLEAIKRHSDKDSAA